QPGHGFRGGRADHRAVLLLARGPGAPGGRLRHALPPEPHRGGVAPGPRPGARRRRPFARVLSQRILMPEYKLPDVGEGLTEAEIVTWKVKVGDVIAVNDIVVEIETAKSLVELPSPYAGTVTALLVAEGETVDVGTPIIAIGDPSTSSGGSGAAPAAAPAPSTESDPYLGLAEKAGAKAAASDIDMSNPAAT